MWSDIYNKFTFRYYWCSILQFNYSQSSSNFFSSKPYLFVSFSNSFIFLRFLLTTTFHRLLQFFFFRILPFSFSYLTVYFSLIFAINLKALTDNAASHRGISPYCQMTPIGKHCSIVSSSMQQIIVLKLNFLPLLFQEIKEALKEFRIELTPCYHPSF